MARFLPTTIGNLFSEPSTRKYPYEKREPFAGARGHLEITIDNCVFCGICARKCPSRAIAVDKQSKTWALTGFQCIMCEVCVEVCPKKALESKPVYRTPNGVKLVEVYTQGEAPAIVESTTRNVGEFKVLRNLYYFPGHTWARMDGDRVRIGVDDFAARILGEVSSIVLGASGEVLERGSAALVCTCADKTATLASPVEAMVLKSNEALAKDPGILRKDPYGEGWVYEVAALNPYEDFRELHFGYGAEMWLKGDVERLYHDVEKELGVTAADGGLLAENLAGRLSADAWKDFTKSFFRV